MLCVGRKSDKGEVSDYVWETVSWMKEYVTRRPVVFRTSNPGWTPGKLARVDYVILCGGAGAVSVVHPAPLPQSDCQISSCLFLL